MQKHPIQTQFLSLHLFRFVYITYTLFCLLVFQARGASAPVVWTSSAFFKAGTATINGLQNDLNVAITVTFSTPLTSPPTQGVALGIINYNFNVSSEINFSMSYANTGSASSFAFVLTGAFGPTAKSLQFTYLAVDPSFTSPFSISQLTDQQSAWPGLQGPFDHQISINFTASTGVTLNLSNENGMVPFLNVIILRRAANFSSCVQLNLSVLITSPNLYTAKLNTTCDMKVLKYGFSRLIFDKTAIENLGYSFFQFGWLSTADAKTSPISLTLTPFIPQNFMMGLGSFKIDASASLLSFNSTIASTSIISSTQPNVILRWTYFSFKYRTCPVGKNLFDPITQMCYDICPAKTYPNSTTQTCKPCHYTCFNCQFFEPQNCTDCNALSNRQLNDMSCDPKPGYYDNGNYEAEPCNETLPQCLSCKNSTVCELRCSPGTFYSLGVCQACQNGITVCPTCILGSNNCFSCNYSLVVSVSGLQHECVVCNDVACTYCTRSDICQTCKSGFLLDQDGVCSFGCENIEFPKTIPFVVFPTSTCSLLNFLVPLSTSILCLSLLLMILSMFSTSLLGIELSGTLQLSFLSLSTHPKLHPYLMPLISWVYSNGYNILFESGGVSDAVSVMRYSAAFIHNVNIMFAILLSFCVLAVIVFAVGRIFVKVKRNKAYMYVLKIVNTFLLTLLLFNTYNVSFSIGLYISTFQQSQHILSSVGIAFAITIYFLGSFHCLRAGKEWLGWGSYWQCLKNDSVSQLYIWVTLVGRFGLGIYLGLGNNQNYVQLIVLVFPLIGTLYTLINLPYTNHYHNYRSLVCHISNMIVLCCPFYYQSLTKNESVQSRFTSNEMAIIQILSIFVCVLVSWGVFVYEIGVKGVRIWKEIRGRNWVKNEEGSGGTGPMITIDKLDVED